MQKKVMYRTFTKRILDVVFAVIFIVISIPISFIASLLIVLDSRGPIFFTQIRVGKNLRTFRVYKFRTMTDKDRTVSETPLIGKAPGVTKVGYYLRRFKIDELPQLYNVVKGDMSLVGPRPSVPEHLEAMNIEQKVRYSVRPGLTGLAQVSGNIHLPWNERFILDNRYVKNMGLTIDIKILLRTLLIIIKGEQYFKNKPLST